MSGMPRRHSRPRNRCCDGRDRASSMNLRARWDSPTPHAPWRVRAGRPSKRGKHAREAGDVVAARRGLRRATDEMASPLPLRTPGIHPWRGFGCCRADGRVGCFPAVTQMDHVVSGNLSGSDFRTNHRAGAAWTSSRRPPMARRDPSVHRCDARPRGTDGAQGRVPIRGGLRSRKSFGRTYLRYRHSWHRSRGPRSSSASRSLLQNWSSR